jgi:hypothetical protein
MIYINVRGVVVPWNGKITTKWVLLVLSQTARYPQRPLDTKNDIILFSFHLGSIMTLYNYLKMFWLGDYYNLTSHSGNIENPLYQEHIV